MAYPFSLLTLVDRVISLVREQKTRRKEYFVEIVEPLYSEFKPLGQDLLALVRTTRDGFIQLEGGLSVHSANDMMEEPLSLGSYVELLQQEIRAECTALTAQRERFMDARHKLIALLGACKHDLALRGETDLCDFFTSMIDFFNPNALTPNSMGLEIVKLFESAVLSPDDRHNVREGKFVLYGGWGVEGYLRYLQSVSANLDARWFEIAGRYMALKIRNTVK